MKYFDYAASAPIHPEVLEILSATQLKDFANPSSQHILGSALFEKLEDFRASFLKVLGADVRDQFIFTSSATESNNTVIKGLNLNPEDVILFSRADHPSISASVDTLNVTKKEIKLNADGTIDLEFFTSLLNDKVKLVILSHVNNQNGVVHNVFELSKIVKEKTAAHVHIDAVQSFGKIPFKMVSTVDSLSVTAHKIGGPKGIAGLFLKKGHKVAPLISGGNQEGGFRSSTSPFPLIAGFHTAMKISIGDKDLFARASRFSEITRAKLSAEIPEAIFPFNSTSPFIIAMILPGISSDIILRHLETRDVYISSTSACSSKKLGFNASLAAMNIAEKFHKNFLRISFGAQTTEAEIDVLTREFIDVWNDIKHMRIK